MDKYIHTVSLALIDATKGELSKSGIIQGFKKRRSGENQSRFMNMIVELYPDLQTNEVYQLSSSMSVLIRKHFDVRRVEHLTPEQYEEALVLVGAILHLTFSKKGMEE